MQTPHRTPTGEVGTEKEGREKGLVKMKLSISSLVILQKKNKTKKNSLGAHGFTYQKKKGMGELMQFLVLFLEGKKKTNPKGSLDGFLWCCYFFFCKSEEEEEEFVSMNLSITYCRTSRRKRKKKRGCETPPNLGEELGSDSSIFLKQNKKKKRQQKGKIKRQFDKKWCKVWGQKKKKKNENR